MAWSMPRSRSADRKPCSPTVPLYHRVAIANSRLIALDHKGVTFRWKDYRLDGCERTKTMTLAPPSSSAASSATCYPTASTASAITACLPAARASPQLQA